MIKFLDLKQQYISIKDDIDAAVATVINNSAFIGGSIVNDFENQFAAYQQAQFCIGVGNGTDALEIAIEALHLPEGSEIIVPANSFVASAEAIVRTGHKVVFCDANSDDYTICITDIKKRITPNTAAIMAVHLYGHPCDMDPLLELAKTHQLKIIEDCAQAHGAEYKGRRVGSIGDVGCFSFYPGKNLGAYGDGGAIVCNDATIEQYCRKLANHGRITKYNHEFVGRNSRLDTLQAAVLSVKLKHLDKWTDHRIEIADYYNSSLNNIDQLILPVRQKWAKQVYHLYAVRHPMRDLLQQHLTNNNIQTGVHYPISLPHLQAFKMTSHDSSMSSLYHGEKLLSLPIGDHLSPSNLIEIINSIISFKSQ